MDKTKELSEYLWKWPLIRNPDQFDSWESSKPELVNYGLGDEPSDDLLSALEKLNIEEYRFRKIVSGLIEILWESFWGASQNEQSLEALSTVLRSCNLHNLPVLTPFKFSLFSDRGGWGKEITEEDRDFWKTCFQCN